jgi:hypothetical protein
MLLIKSVEKTVYIPSNNTFDSSEIFFCDTENILKTPKRGVNHLNHHNHKITFTPKNNNESERDTDSGQPSNR